MNKFILSIAAVLLTTAAFSQVDSAQAIATPTSGTATVYFMRSTGFTGSAQGFTVFIDDAIVCKINNKRYSTHTIPAGKHIFSAQFAGKKSKEKAERIEIEMEEGKEYYIQLIFQNGILVNNIYCQEVTKSSAAKILASLKQDPCN
jgi:hypothetical protein